MLSDAELLAAIDAAEQMALGPTSSEIASDRADAIDRYLGKAYGDEQAGRSQVVSRDVSDVVEGVCANVLKPFVAGDQVVEFNPHGPEDEEQAEQETDYVNFIALERNNGFLVLTAAVKDALLLRNGYVKMGWRKREDITIEMFEGKSDDELVALMSDPDVEVFQHSEYPDPYAAAAAQMAPHGMPAAQAMQGPAFAPGAPMGQPAAPPAMLHDVKVRRKRPTEYCEILPAPANEIRVSQRLNEPSVQNADFVQHATHKTISELRELGYELDDEIPSDDDEGQTIEEFSRDNFTTPGDRWNDPTQDMSRRLVLFKESWIRIDRDGDGIAELRRVCSVGKTLLSDEEADLIPIACFTSVIFPHRHLGISVYDLVKDLAQIKTAVTRGFLDNLYLQNNAEKIVDIDRVIDVNDFLTSRPGGIKRVQGDPSTVVVPLITPYVGQGALQGLEYLDAVRENRTGYTRSAQGMDSNSLATQTATGYMQQVSQSAMRLEMIGRTIAETGMRDMFRLIHAITLKHSTRDEKVRLRNKWVLVNPREWVRRTDMRISVGLGTTSGQQQMQSLMMIGQAQQQAMPLGIVTPENVYNTLKKLANSAGFKNPDEFFTAPPPGPMPPQKDPVLQAEEMKGQNAMQLKQMDMQGQHAALEHKAATDDKRAQQDYALQASNDQRQAALDQEKMLLEREKMEREFQLKERELAMKYELERWKTEYTASHQTDLESTKLNYDAQKTVATHKSKEEEHSKALAPVMEQLQALHESANAPKKVVRGPDGRVTGVESAGKVRKVTRDPSGRVEGLQ